MKGVDDVVNDDNMVRNLVLPFLSAWASKQCCKMLEICTCGNNLYMLLYSIF